jgi:hypothetical protein
MHMLGWLAALIAPLGFGLLVLGVLTGPPRTHVAASTADAEVPLVTPTTVLTAAAPLDFDLAFDEATLTRDLNAWAVGQPPVPTPLGMTHLADLSVQLHDSELTIHGTAQTALIHAPVDLVASTAVQGGRLLVQVRGAQVDGIQLPGVVRSQLEQQMQDQLDKSVGGNHIAVRSVRIGDGMLAVSGTRS